MGLINRQIMRYITFSALLAALIVAFIVVAGAIQEQLKTLLEELPVAPLQMTDIMRISLYALPSMASYIIPVTFLMGIMFSFSRMAHNDELIALKAAGISLRRMVVPILLAGAFLSVACFFIQEKGQPWAYAKMKQLMTSDLPLRMTLDILPKGRMHSFRGWQVYIGDKDEDGAMRNLVVLQPLENGKMQAFYAAEAQLRKNGTKNRLFMRDVHAIQEGTDGVIMSGFLKEQEMAIPPMPSKSGSTHRHGLPLRGLLQEEVRMTEEHAKYPTATTENSLQTIRKEIGQRFSFSLMCLAVCFVAAPAGVRIRRKGRSFAFAIGMGIVAFYFILQESVEPNVLPTLQEAMLRAQIPNVVLLCLGTWMLYRVNRV